MNAGEFAKRRARIEGEHHRGRRYRRRALAALIKEARAAYVIVHGKAVAWRMTNGQVVCKKRRYENEATAQSVLAGVIHHPRTKKHPARAYLCPHCNGWHLTSQHRP